MKKQILAVTGCIALVLVGGLALTACDGSKDKTEDITKAELNTYITETATTHFDKGYISKVKTADTIGYIEVVKNGASIDAKVTSTNRGEDYAMYVKNGEAFTQTELGLVKMQEDVSFVINQLTAPLENYSAFTVSLLAPDSTKVTKKTEGNKITFDYVDQIAARYEEGGTEPAEPTVKYDVNVEFSFVNNALAEMEIESVDPNKFVYSFEYEEFSGPVDYSDVDLYDYVKDFTLGNVEVTLTNKFIQQSNTYGFDYRLKKQGLEFLIQHEDVSAYPDMTTQQYAAAWEERIRLGAQNTQSTMTSSQIISDPLNDLVYVKYDSVTSNKTYAAVYAAFIFKDSNNIFYVCQFGCYKTEFAQLENQIINWAKTIRVN